MEDCGEAKICLGPRIDRERRENGVESELEKCKLKKLERFEMLECPSCARTIGGQICFYMICNSPVLSLSYCKAIDSLMCLMVLTRPNLAFVVGRLSRYSENQGMHYRLLYEEYLDVKVDLLPRRFSLREQKPG